MQTRKILIAISILALSALVCSLGDLGVPQDVVTTLTAGVPALQTELANQLTQQAVTPAASVPAMGSISGTLNYPADSLPAMRVVAFSTATNQPYYADTQLGQPSYQIPALPAGTYYVVAYSLGGGPFPVGLSGGYTAAVPCGLTDSCTDHALLPVSVSGGQDTGGIRPADWNAPAGTFPPMPGAPVVTQSPQPTQSAQGGQISGRLSYPSEFIPPLAVVAFRVGSPSEYHYVLTVQDQAEYLLSAPEGTYFVVAYIASGDYAGGFTRAVPCGLSVDCTDHTLLPVQVTNGSVTQGIDPGDWYAPEGAFPLNPVK